MLEHIAQVAVGGAAGTWVWGIFNAYIHGPLQDVTGLTDTAIQGVFAFVSVVLGITVVVLWKYYERRIATILKENQERYDALVAKQDSMRQEHMRLLTRINDLLGDK